MRRVHSGQIRRAGITLVELLVVVGIMMMLMVVALPSAMPRVETRRIREAARAMDIFFGSARNQAIVSGRPVGVMLQRIAGRPEGCLTLYQVEVPASYSGDPLDCKMTVAYIGQDTTTRGQRFRATMIGSGLIMAGLVHPNDLIQFNGQGPLYRIISGSTVNTTRQLGVSSIVPPFILELDPWLGVTSPFQTTSGTATFRIYRQPIRSLAPPLEMPATIAIDLQFSGLQSALQAFQPNRAQDYDAVASSTRNLTTPVVIMFSPSGSVDRVYYSNAGALGYQQVYEMIYLLIGKRDRIPVSSSPDGRGNWADPNNLWVTISPKSGMVSAKEVYPVTNPTPSAAAFQQQLLMSQALARQSEGVGGR